MAAGRLFQRAYVSRAIQAFVATFFFWCFVSTYSQKATAQSTPGSGVEISKSVGEIAMKAAPTGEPPAQLKLLRGTIDGGSSDARWERHFQRLENGLWGVTVVSSGRVTSIRRWITLQGIVTTAGARRWLGTLGINTAQRMLSTQRRLSCLS